ncbi:MAG: hypothetical protein AAF228_08465 [Pseudomonadota bacterium]
MVQTDEKIAELILEKLRRIENDIADLDRETRQGLKTLQGRLNAMDDRLGAVDKHISSIYALLTSVGGDVDYLKLRLKRIEDRLDIVDDIPSH